MVVKSTTGGFRWLDDPNNFQAVKWLHERNLPEQEAQERFPPFLDVVVFLRIWKMTPNPVFLGLVRERLQHDYMTDVSAMRVGSIMLGSSYPSAISGQERGTSNGAPRI